jgi:sugar lactone lactonase YvrE
MTAVSTTTVFWPGRAALGEGPLWDPRIDTLYWVDIVAGTLFAQAAGAHEPIRIDVGAQVGCLGLTDDPQVLVAGMRISVPRPTSLAFGGPNLCTMFITTASIGLTEDQLAEWPLSGRCCAAPPTPRDARRATSV